MLDDMHLPRHNLPICPRLQLTLPPLQDCIGAWAQRLAWHPDAEFEDYVPSGIQHCFRIGTAYSTPLPPSLARHPVKKSYRMDKMY